MAWKKLLYLSQAYPDNYTDKSFLDQLKRNTTVVRYSYRKLISDFTLISFYGTLLVLVCVNFVGIYTSLWAPFPPTLILSAFAFLGLIIVPSPRGNSAAQVKLYFIISVFLLLLSPVLRSLTESTSLDSIWALSSILCVLSVVTHDYALDPKLKYRPIFSTNLSFANGIMLALRLQLLLSAFCFLVFSMEVAILVPLFELRLRKSKKRFVVVAVAYAVTTALLAYVYGVRVTSVYVLGVMFVLVFLPCYYVFLQKYKNELQGPWDTAKPVIRSL